MHPLPLLDSSCSPTTSWGWTHHEDCQCSGKGTPPAAAQAKSCSCITISSPIWKNLHMFSEFPKGFTRKTLHDLGSLKASPGYPSATPAFASEMEPPLVKVQPQNLQPVDVLNSSIIIPMQSFVELVIQSLFLALINRTNIIQSWTSRAKSKKMLFL